LAANTPTVAVETALAERVFRQLERNMRVLFGARELSVLLAAASSLDEDLVTDISAQKSNHELTRVFRYLLEDGVPLRPLRLLFESLSSWINLDPKADPVFLAECLRQSMKRQLCQNLASADGELGVSLLSPALQERLMADLSRIRQATGDLDLDGLPLDPSTMDVLLAEARRLTDADVENSRRIAIVTIPQLRRRLRNTLANAGINLPVVSPHEITSEILTFPVNVLGEGFVSQYQPIDKAGSAQPVAGRKSRDRSDLPTDLDPTPKAALT
jgi:type III secretion protein V